VKLIKNLSKEKIFLKMKLIIKFGFLSTLSINLTDNILNKKIEIMIGIDKKKLK
jgi:hypothetical protein